MPSNSTLEGKKAPLRTIKGKRTTLGQINAMRRFILKDGLQDCVKMHRNLATQLRNKGWVQRDTSHPTNANQLKGWVMVLTDEGKEVIDLLLKGKGKYWTGLCGDHHQQEARLGTDFIVVYYPSAGLVAYDEDGLADTDEFLKKVNADNWLRIRAITSQAAINRYRDAEDQQRVWFNAPNGNDAAKNAPIVESLEHYWEGHENLYLDVVKLPPSERPEIIDVQEYLAGMMVDEVIQGSAPQYLRDLAERLMHIPVCYGTDQADVDKLNTIAESLEATK